MEQLSLSLKPSPEATYKNRDWMEKQYIQAKRSESSLAREISVNRVTIHNWLVKFNIPRRNLSKATHLARVNHVDLTPELLELIEGELLGDGSLRLSSKWSAHYQHSSQHKPYVEWLSKVLASFGVQQSGKINSREKEDGHIGYSYTSLSYEEFQLLQFRWYPEGKKIVPPDLILTPLIVRQWYIGDGSLKKPKKYSPAIILSSPDFPQEDIERLIAMLKGLGFDASRWPSTNEIYISTYSTKQFLDYIGPCPQEIQNIYGYKFDYKGETPASPTSQYQGVCWHKRANKWQVRLQAEKRGIHLGYFEDEREAARAYDAAARKYRGEKARLNFPSEEETPERRQHAL